MDKILSGKAVAQHIRTNVKKNIENLLQKQIKPVLAILRVGMRSDDIAYERAIVRACEEVGVKAEIMTYEADICMVNFVKELKALNENKEINGIMIFRPLPKQLNEDYIKNIIAPNKDIDCMNPENMVKLFEGDTRGLLPCTPSAVLELMKYYNISMEGKHIAILGRSMVVGKPLSMLLLKENATVTICHSKTKDLEEITSRADIVIAAIGKPRFVKQEFLKHGSIVIDVGINMDEEGKLCGDVDYDDVFDKVAAITPVLGGVGTVTTSVLLKNLAAAAEKQIG